jgi:hypothetical protein
MSWGTWNKLSDNNSGRIRSSWYVLSLSNNSLLAKHYKTLAVYWTPDSLQTAWPWKRTKGPFFSLRPDKNGVTYRISINKQLRDFAQANHTSCGNTMQCVSLSNLMCLKRKNLSLRSTTAEPLTDKFPLQVLNVLKKALISIMVSG